MKKYISLTPTSLYAVCIIILFGLTDCKKSNTAPTAADDTFSFNYNGIQYSLKPLSDEYRVDSMTISITRPDIFTGAILYKKPDCAYYAKDNSTVYMSGKCQLTNGSKQPIDSANVYIFQSGSLNVSYSNCSSYTVTDFSGHKATITNCDMVGTFNLVLKNSENKLVTLSNGKFVQYHMLKSYR